MQANTQPSRWALLGAQFLAYFLTVLFVLILFFTFASTQYYFSPNYNPSQWWTVAIPVLFSGVILAALQRSSLRKWMPANRKWLVVSGLVLPVLFLGEYGLFTRLVFQPSPHYWIAAYSPAGQAVNAAIERWSLVGGLIVGLPGGLLFGLVQSTLLPWHRRWWLALSTLAWAVISALALASLNIILVLLSENV